MYSPVALLVSAWIEIIHEKQLCAMQFVALLVSAWIEILKPTCGLHLLFVALLVSAWIEITVLLFSGF